MTIDWTEVATAALTATLADSAPSKGEGLEVTLVFVAPGEGEGALRFGINHGLAGPAQELADRLRAEVNARVSVPGFHVVWHGATRGAPRVTGQHVREGVTLSVEVTAQPRTLAHEELQLTQLLHQVQDLSEKSVLAIGRRIRAIQDLAAAHAESLNQVAAQYAVSTDANAAKASISTTIDDLTSHLRTFGSALTDRVAMQTRDIEQARVWTNDIMRLGQTIADIATSARLLTFNARVESARLGPAGRGFAVISQAIQDLALQIREANDSVAKLTASLAKALPKLISHSAQISSEVLSSVGVFESRLGELHKLLETARQKAHDTVTASSSKASALQEQANDALLHLQFQDRTSAILQKALAQAEVIMDAAGVSETMPAAHPVGKRLTEPGTVDLFA